LGTILLISGPPSKGEFKKMVKGGGLTEQMRKEPRWKKAPLFWDSTEDQEGKGGPPGRKKRKQPSRHKKKKGQHSFYKALWGGPNREKTCKKAMREGP